MRKMNIRDIFKEKSRKFLLKKIFSVFHVQNPSIFLFVCLSYHKIIACAAYFVNVNRDKIKHKSLIGRLNAKHQIYVAAKVIFNMLKNTCNFAIKLDYFKILFMQKVSNLNYISLNCRLKKLFNIQIKSFLK